VASVEANAGAFAIREQSVYGQGASFAGIAAGGALSSMFWNPSTITQFAGKNIEFGGAAIFPHAEHSYSSSFLATAIPPLYAKGVDNSGAAALVPSSYSSFQLSERLWVGMSTSAPFGLSVQFPRTWAGAGYAQDSSIVTYNFSPTVAYKVADWLSLGAGLQAQYMKVSYGTLTVPATMNTADISGRGWGWGFTAGATITPLPGTTIGIGYRSAIDQKIDGSLESSTALPATTTGPVNLTLNLPDSVTVGLRQRLSDRWTGLAGFEWTNWSRIGTTRLMSPNGAATLGGTAIVFPFNYSDGYFYSLGAEYMYDPALIFRAGIAFEKSPITDNVRTPRLPDNDRMWYSVGATYKPAQLRGLTFDAAYSFIDVKSTPIDISAASGNPWLNGTGTYTGSVKSQIHILSLALRYQWGVEQAVAVKKITK